MVSDLEQNFRAKYESFELSSCSNLLSYMVFAAKTAVRFARKPHSRKPHY